MNIDSIKCQQCMEIMNLPVFLPCGHTICKHHVDKAVENKETNITCKMCDKLIDIPVNGFVPNRFVESLLDEMKKADLEEKSKSGYDLAIETVNSFEELLEEFNRIQNDPEMKIHTVINELRSKVDLRREELKQKIDRKALALIERIDEFEKECKSNASNVKSDCKLDEKLEMLKNELDETRKSSVTLFESVEKRMRIIDESKSAIKKLQSEFFKFNESLFLNRLNSFGNLDESVFYVHFPIRMTVKCLSKYKDVNEESNPTTIALYKENAFGIDWSLVVEQGKETKEKENYFGLYLLADQNSRIENLQVDFDLEILDQFGMGKSYIENISNLFDSDCVWGWGIKEFISFKDLLKDYNLYNIESDSCTVQALIKRIEWVKKSE